MWKALLVQILHKLLSFKFHLLCKWLLVNYCVIFSASILQYAFFWSLWSHISICASFQKLQHSSILQNCRVLHHCLVLTCTSLLSFGLYNNTPLSRQTLKDFWTQEWLLTCCFTGPHPSYSNCCIFQYFSRTTILWHINKHTIFNKPATTLNWPKQPLVHILWS